MATCKQDCEANVMCDAGLWTGANCTNTAAKETECAACTVYRPCFDEDACANKAKVILRCVLSSILPKVANIFHTAYMLLKPHLLNPCATTEAQIVLLPCIFCLDCCCCCCCCCCCKLNLLQSCQYFVVLAVTAVTLRGKRGLAHENVSLLWPPAPG